MTVPAEPPQPIVTAFKDELTGRGYVEGENITYAYLEAGTPIQSFVDQGVDMIVTFTNGQTTEALAATETIPVIGARFTYAVESGYAESLAEPGGNFTGVDIGPLAPQAIELMLEMFPETQKIYIPMQIGYPTAEIGIPQIEPIAEEHGVELLVERFENADGVEAALEALPEDVDAIFTFAGSLTASVPLMVETATERGIPSAGTAGEGLILVYGADSVRNGELAAGLADQVLKGANPGELPIQFGESSIIINLQSADAAGVEIADNFLTRADTIIRAEA
ncbi:MAG: ABC transporter substrate-binding protein [Burkholderiales bacterium]|nr:ABC transporter substrate-binding protein [Anaerolineae bacterium]